MIAKTIGGQRCHDIKNWKSVASGEKPKEISKDDAISIAKKSVESLLSTVDRFHKTRPSDASNNGVSVLNSLKLCVHSFYANKQKPVAIKVLEHTGTPTNTPVLRPA